MTPPEDVQATAERLLATWRADFSEMEDRRFDWGSASTREDLTRGIAAALLAERTVATQRERERCVQVVLHHVNSQGPLRQQLAKAIGIPPMEAR